jgi:hypothetical protein
MPRWMVALWPTSLPHRVERRMRKCGPMKAVYFVCGIHAPSFARARSQQLSLSVFARTEQTRCIAPGLFDPSHSPNGEQLPWIIILTSTCMMAPRAPRGPYDHLFPWPPGTFGKLTMGWSFVLHGLVIASKDWTFVEAIAYWLLRNFRRDLDPAFSMAHRDNTKITSKSPLSVYCPCHRCPVTLPKPGFCPCRLCPCPVLSPSNVSVAWARSFFLAFFLGMAIRKWSRPLPKQSPPCNGAVTCR